jgi:putative ABC transport system permease protein
MKLLGTNNIIIKTVDENTKNEKIKEEQKNEETTDVTKKKKKFSPGLTLKDVKSIEKIIPNVQNVSPEVIIETLALHKGFKEKTKLVGIDTSYFQTNQFSLYRGRFFSESNIEKSESACLIGYGIKTKLFPTDDPIGAKIKCGNQWLTVIGVLAQRNISKDNIQNLGIRDYNLDIYIPITTMLLRFENRSLITKDSKSGGGIYVSGGSFISFSDNNKAPNQNQLDRIIVNLKDSKHINTIAEILSRMLQRRHNMKVDYEIIVPELLLEQEQRTKRIFNIVLGAIASISLIVGGIGIMNIMLASVLERTKEIGIRRALGAKRRDIIFQFLIEAISISLTGGIVGIILGFAISYVIEKSTDIHTIVSAFSVFLSFFVSLTVGLVFGIMPARRAAFQDPIESLRWE